jgi:hypothetical protein
VTWQWDNAAGRVGIQRDSVLVLEAVPARIRQVLEIPGLANHLVFR